MREAAVLLKLADNIAVKVPLTIDGLKACKALSGDGAVVNRDSKNLEAFNQVITQMKEDGTRDKLFQQYFAEQAAVPEIPV